MPERADRHRRHGLPLPRRATTRTPSGGCSATAATPSARSRRTAGTRTRFYDPEPRTPGKMRTRWGGFLDDVDQFDPQLLRHLAPRGGPAWTRSSGCCWRSPGRRWRTPASRRSGCAGSRDRRLRRHLAAATTASPAASSDRDRGIDAYSGTGNALQHRRQPPLLLPRPARARAWRSTPPARRRWSPSTSPARACARGECALALAGGVNLILTPERHVGFSQARHAVARRPLQDLRRRAPTATCAARAAAWSCSSRCRDALARRRPHPTPSSAAPRSTRTAARNGLTAPNGAAQAGGASAQALPQRRRDARPTSSYVEAHGTGTPLGDPIEAAALGDGARHGRPAGQPLRDRLGEDEHRPPGGRPPASPA